MPNAGEFECLATVAAACRHCNYSGGREIQLANRTDRQLLNHYEQIIERQRAELDELGRRWRAMWAREACQQGKAAGFQEAIRSLEKSVEQLGRLGAHAQRK